MPKFRIEDAQTELDEAKAVAEEVEWGAKDPQHLKKLKGKLSKIDSETIQLVRHEQELLDEELLMMEYEDQQREAEEAEFPPDDFDPYYPEDH